MSTVDLWISGVAALGLAVWIRGCVTRSVADCALGLLVAAVAVAGYFITFSLTRTAYLGVIIFAPFLLMLLPFRSMVTRTSGKVLAGIVLILLAGTAFGEYKLVSMGNALLTIEPYRSGKIWRFDEPLLHLKGEPFVQGIPEMIDKMVEGIPGSDKSVRLIFSQQQFPGWRYRLDRRREQDGGNWYYNEEFKMEGWLCPALFKFFPRAPAHIYFKAEAK